MGMNRQYSNAFYKTSSFSDSTKGCGGMELHQVLAHSTACVAKITFWDAAGQFYVETNGTELPLEIVEEFIAEVKASVKTS